MLDRTSIGTIAPRLAQLVRMLASPVDGEALSAARAMGRALAEAGLDFHDLAVLIEREALPSPTSASPLTPTYETESEPAARPAKPPAEPNPWPSWGDLRHSERVAWVSQIEDAGQPLDIKTRRSFDVLREQILGRSDERLTGRSIRLFDRLVRGAWKRGARV